MLFLYYILRFAADNSTATLRAFNSTTTSITQSNALDQLYHLEQYRLLAFGSLSQILLYDLLNYLSVKVSGIQSKEEALSYVLSTNKEKLKELFKNGSESIYDKYPDQIKRKVDAASFDTSAFISILSGMSEFDISKPSVRKVKCSTSGHIEKCCSACHNVKHHFKCNKPNCDKSCWDRDDPCQFCKTKALNCLLDTFVCCKECKSCLNCFQSSKNIDSLIQELLELDEEQIKVTTKACPTFLLRLSVELIRQFRNFMSHANMNRRKQMTNGTFKDNSLPSCCTSWVMVHEVFKFAINYVLLYLKLNDKLPPSYFREQKDFLRNVSVARSLEELNRFTNNIDNYVAVEKIDMKEMSRMIKTIETATTKPLLKIKILYKSTESIELDYFCKEASEINEILNNHLTEKGIKVCYEGISPKREDNKQLTIGFKLESSERDLNEYLDPKDNKKGSHLWEIIKNSLEEKLNSGMETEKRITITLLKWIEGSIKITVILQKLSGKEWNEEEENEIYETMPTIVKQIPKNFPEDLSDCTMDYIKKKKKAGITTPHSATLTFRVVYESYEQTDAFDEVEFREYMKSNAKEKGITINGKD